MPDEGDSVEFELSPSAAAALPGGKKTSVITEGEHTQGDDRQDEFLSSPRNPAALELGHFDVLETIGRGGFGVVVKAFDRKLQRLVAIKMMSGELAATSPARKRFVREARAAAAIRHDNVVRIYTVEEQPTPYLVMEYIPGESLQHLLNRTGPLDALEIARLGAQIARGLAAAHDTGLVHRDIKPANVLLEDGERPHVKLTDFGLARAADDASLTQSGMVVGTPMYMSPEQARGDRTDHRADLYSLGSVLYVMASGRPPFRAANSLAVLKRVAEDDARPIQEIIPEVPRWLCDIITKLHAKDPAARFQSAREVAELLEKCLASSRQGHEVSALIVPPPPVAVPSVSQKPPRPRRWKIAGLGALGCVALAAGLYFWPTDKPSPATAFTPPPTPPADDPSAPFTNAIGMKFVRIPAGTATLHGGRAVEFTDDFFVGACEVTQEDWERVMGPGKNPSRYSRAGTKKDRVADIPDATLKRFPVEAASWNDCQSFIKQLNRQLKEPGWVYRLPRSAEWEYACRGGSERAADEPESDYYFATPTNTLSAAHANFRDSGLKRPQPVGSYPPNRLGLHDMHGNVFELCDDVAGTEGEPLRLLRGGFWDDGADICRAGGVNLIAPTTRYEGSGLRLVRVRE